MPTIKIQPDSEMHYCVDDFTDPWRKAEVVLLLHGSSENHTVWFGWVPHLARHLRVVRPDMRGFGRSTPMPRDFPWTLDVVIEDFIQLMNALRVERFHLVGAKLGGTIARALAARHPQRIATLTLVGTPPPVRPGANEEKQARIEHYETKGVDSRSSQRMALRLGSAFPAAGIEWWHKLMEQAPASTKIGFISVIAYADITSDLPNIKCPTLVITTENSALGSVEMTRAWQKLIANSRLLIIPGDSYHVAASDPDRCAQATLEFIRKPCT